MPLFGTGDLKLFGAHAERLPAKLLAQAYVDQHKAAVARIDKPLDMAGGEAEGIDTAIP